MPSRKNDGRRDSPHRRRQSFRELRPRILIVCEGAKTEPLYFKSFRVTSAQVEVVGTGANTLSVVEVAQNLAAEARRKKEPFQHVWCVFDRDSFPVERFNGALQEARKAGFGCAWSNECFEIWYILHFCYIDAAVSRTTYKERLSRHLGFPYEKNLPQIYEHLIEHQSDALRNADRLLGRYRSADPANDNPCTTVQELVRLLNTHQRG